MSSVLKPGFLRSMVLGGLLFGCSVQEGEPNNTEPESPSDGGSGVIMVTRQQFEASGMKLGTLEERMFPKVVKASGYLDVPPEHRAQVSTFMAGYIQSIPLLEGDRVKKGQFLARLQNIDYIQIQQDFLETREQLSYLRSEFQRQKTLAGENIASQKTFAKAQSEYKTKVAQYEALGKKLRLLNIDTAKIAPDNMVSSINLYAPIGGYVTAVHATKGAYVAPQDVVVELVNPKHLHVELQVFEKDIMRVKVGQEMSFRIPEAGDTSYQAVVHQVGRTVEGDQRTIRVHGHLRQDHLHFVPGMFVEAEIIVSNDKLMGVPEEAVVLDSDNQYLLIKTHEQGDTLQFSRKPVTLGRQYDQWSVLLSPGQVHADDQILVKGAFDVAGGGIE